MTEFENEYQTDAFVRAARLIRQAGSVAEAASAVLRAVVDGSPRTAKTWRLRAVVRSTVEARLHRLELLVARKLATSPEIASDMRLDAARHIARVLAAVSANSELNASVAELAAHAVTHLSKSSDALTRALSDARQSTPGRPLAFATMGGRLFTASPVLEFARAHEIAEAELDQILQQVAQPLRRACESEDVCHIGQLRYSRRIEQHGITVRAELNTATDVHAAPLIRIELLAADETTAAATPQASPEPSGDAYSARLLRQLVS